MKAQLVQLRGTAHSSPHGRASR